MTLKSPHKDWKLNQLAVPDARAVGIEQLITQLWLRVAYDNLPTTPTRETHKRVASSRRRSRAPATPGLRRLRPRQASRRPGFVPTCSKVFKRTATSSRSHAAASAGDAPAEHGQGR